MMVNFEADACTPPYISSGSASDYPNATTQGLSVVRAGSLVPQERLLELKTSKTIKWPETLPQLVLSGTPGGMLGTHTSGVFSAVSPFTVNTAPGDTRAKLDRDMVALAGVLRELQTLMTHGKTRRASLIYNKDDLKVHARTTPALLPEDLLARFQPRE
jgi:hypothetical protein